MNRKEKQQLALRMMTDEDFALKTGEIVKKLHARRAWHDPVFAAAIKALQAQAEFPAIFRRELASLSGKDGKAALAGLRGGVALASPTTDADDAFFLTRQFATFWTMEARDQRVFQSFARKNFEPNRGVFEIAKGGGEVVFRRREPLERVPLSDVGRDVASYPFDSYHGGMTWNMLIGDASNAADLIENVSGKISAGAAYTNARVTYQVLVASALSSAIIPLNLTGASDLEDRILTLNDARDAFAASLKDEKSESGETTLDLASANLNIYVNAKPSRVSQLQTALDYNPSTSQTNAGTERVVGQYTVLPTYMLRDANGDILDDRYVVIAYPGRENGYADKRALSMTEGTDWERLMNGMAGEFAFGAGCNNKFQNRVVQLWA